MTEHQQLPWTWHAKSKDQAHNGSIYRMERPGHAYAIAMQPQYVEDAQFKADAAYIVNACNAYPDLVKALEDALRELSACSIQMNCRSGGSVVRAIEAARQVLAAVKGVSKP